MKKFSQEQKKIIYITSVVLGFLFLAWIFIYLPQSRRLISIQKKLIATEDEISQINKITQGKTLEEAVKSLNLELNQAIANLPSRQEDVIGILSDEARKLKIDVRVMDPADNPQATTANVAGFTITELPIVMQLVCDYRTIGEYLNILDQKLPLLIKIRQLNISGGEAGNSNLDINLEISVYLSG